MTLEQYMRELWLMDKQYGQEEELYPLINMLLRDGPNTENLSIRDVHKGQRIKTENKNKNVEQRKYIDGFGSFPDIAIFDESFPEKENIDSNLQKIYGCVEAKCISQELIECLDLNTIEIICKENKKNKKNNENEEISWIDYYVKKNKTLLNESDGRAKDAGQLLGELLWYGKVLYTNGVIWKYYTLSKESGNKINGIRKDYISNPPSKGEVGYKTWIFEQCKETPLKIKSKNIGDLTKIYNKIKDKTSIPTFNFQDYHKWKKFKTNLAAINWTKDIF